MARITLDSFAAINYPIEAVAARNSKFFQDFENDWVRRTRWVDTSAEALLNQVTTQRPAEPSASRESVWVFDLDSTLFCVGQRIRSIFFEFVRQHPAPPPRWHRVLQILSPVRQRYDIEATFREIFLEWDRESAAAWAQELWAEFRPFWETHFFGERHLSHDVAYDGAAQFVTRVLDAGYGVVYLTARDRPRSGLGTRTTLRAAGFPMDDRTHLFMKATREESDVIYKRRAASVLRSRFAVRVFVDNEPENLVMFAKDIPAAEIVFFHSVMSERVPRGEFQSVLGARSAWRLETYL